MTMPQESQETEAGLQVGPEAVMRQLAKDMGEKCLEVAALRVGLEQVQAENAELRTQVDELGKKVSDGG